MLDGWHAKLVAVLRGFVASICRCPRSEVATRSISPCRLTSSTTLQSWRWLALHVFDTRSRRPGLETSRDAG